MRGQQSGAIVFGQRLTTQSHGLDAKESDRGAAEAVFLTAEHNRASATPQDNRAQSRSSYSHHGLLGLLALSALAAGKAEVIEWGLTVVNGS